MKTPQMEWPGIDDIRAMTPLPEGYRFELLQRAEIPALVEHIRQWYPDITVGVASCYLREDFYRDKACLGDDVHQDILVVLIKHEHDMVGLVSWEREPDALSLYARFGALCPAHRGAKLAVRTLQLGEGIGRAMGAGFVYCMATLKIPQVQRALERAGYQLLGFAPGYDRELVAPGVIKRIYEAIYAKVLVTGEELPRPDPQNLTPKTKVLFDLLFPP